MAVAMTIEEHEARLAEIQGRQQEIDAEFAGQALPDERREEFERLQEEKIETGRLIAELKERKRVVEENAKDERKTEREPQFLVNRGGVKGSDIYDLSEIRRQAGSPEEESQLLRDAARRHLEGTSFPKDKAAAVAHAERLLEQIDRPDVLARHMLTTGSPVYKRAFGKYIAGRPLTAEESRAMSLTGSAGGFAVPFELDPTVIPTSNGSVNPFRAISRVEQITVDEWRGISSGAITASYAAEATEATDNSPTLAQPTISTEKAQAFIPFSIEIGMDWNGFQAEMGRLLQDAKDDLEATKFALGSGTNEPQGVITGATTVYTAADTDSLTVADLYGLEAALPARFRPNARIVMNRAIAQKFRQFDISTQSSVWQDNLRVGLDNNPQGAYGSALLGYPAYESSAMSAAMTTGQLIAVIGDFRYYVIVDRIGLTVEVIPHLFGTTANYPTGQRGLYAYWRNSAEVISPGAFRVLKLA